MPSVNDCSRTASPPNPIRGGWNASESVAGFRRNHRLEWIGIAGWFASEYAASCSDTEGYEFLVHLRNAPDAAPMTRAEHYPLRRQLFARLAAEQDAFGERTAAGGPAGRRAN